MGRNLTLILRDSRSYWSDLCCKKIPRAAVQGTKGEQLSVVPEHREKLSGGAGRGCSEVKVALGLEFTGPSDDH